MPEAMLFKTSSFSEVLYAPSVCLERLSLHADHMHSFPDTYMAQRLANGRSGALLFGSALTTCLGFLSLARGVDPASPDRLGEHGWRHGTP
jgi:hypothetical protein